mgnify:FL=1
MSGIVRNVFVIQVFTPVGGITGPHEPGNGTQQSAAHEHLSSKEHAPSQQGGFGGSTLQTLPTHCTQEPVLLSASL